MGRAIFLLGLTAMIGAPNLWGQRAVDVKRPEERAREQKVVEREEKKKAKSTDLEIRGATAFKENELRTALKEQIATIHDFGLTAARADDAAFFLELFYRKHGYAKVDVQYRIESGSRLVLQVTEGPQVILSAINFAGNNHVPAEKLFEYAVGPTRERYSRLQKELPFVATDVQEGADLVHRYYISEGYLEASGRFAAISFQRGRHARRCDHSRARRAPVFFRQPDFSREHDLRSGNIAGPDARSAFATVHRPPGR